MARPLRIEYPGATYHVTSRGNERKKIFRDNSDRKRFLEILAISQEIYNVETFSYVLMDNHFLCAEKGVKSPLDCMSLVLYNPLHGKTSTN